MTSVCEEVVSTVRQQPAVQAEVAAEAEEVGNRHFHLGRQGDSRQHTACWN